jgi:superfamily II DNA or RNA helicase
VSGSQALPMRDYQAEGVEALERALARGVRRPAGVLATGLGKTVMFAHLGQRWLDARRREGRAAGLDRVLVLAHRTELINQAASKIKSVAPGLRVGVIQAQRNETLADVVVGSVQTLAGERRRAMLRNVGLVVVDECHHATADSYRKILTHFGALDPASGVAAVGFTATMMRGDRAALGSVWQDVVFTRDYAFGVANGWLVRPRCVYVKVDDLDLSKVKQSRGDYQAADLGEALEASMAPEAIVKALREHAPDRPTILFAPLVRTAELIRDELRANGFTAEVVSAATPAADRERILDDYRARRVQVLCNAMVFTEGTDLPLTSCIVVARPTRNRGLFIQMVGRGGRPAPGKTDLLVLDVTGASLRNSLTLPVELFGDGETREAREPCDCAMWTAREVCPCGARCRKECLCGGGRECGCPRSEVVDGEQVGFEDLGLDLDDASWANGPLVAHEVDLFHGSHNAWMRTNAGVWFLPTGNRYLAIVRSQDGASFDVVSIGAHSGSRWVVQGVGELSYAMAWAEGDVTPTERMIANRETKWRAKKPSDAQRHRARKLGVLVVDGMLSGEVSNRITVAEASWRIDPKLKPWMLGG